MHGFVGAEQMAEAQTLCQGVYSPPPTQACADYLQALAKQWYDLDPYNVYRWCEGAGPDPNGGCLTDRALTATKYGHSLAQTFVPCAETVNEVLVILVG